MSECLYLKEVSQISCRPSTLAPLLVRTLYQWSFGQCSMLIEDLKIHRVNVKMKMSSVFFNTDGQKVLVFENQNNIRSPS